ncbi:unnamed protein product, partial [Prorocentrum cordatum]
MQEADPEDCRTHDFIKAIEYVGWEGMRGGQETLSAQAETVTEVLLLRAAFFLVWVSVWFGLIVHLVIVSSAGCPGNLGPLDALACVTWAMADGAGRVYDSSDTLAFQSGGSVFAREHVAKAVVQSVGLEEVYGVILKYEGLGAAADFTSAPGGDNHIMHVCPRCTTPSFEPKEWMRYAEQASYGRIHFIQRTLGHEPSEQAEMVCCGHDAVEQEVILAVLRCWAGGARAPLPPPAGAGRAAPRGRERWNPARSDGAGLSNAARQVRGTTGQVSNQLASFAPLALKVQLAGSEQAAGLLEQPEDIGGDGAGVHRGQRPASVRQPPAMRELLGLDDRRVAAWPPQLCGWAVCIGGGSGEVPPSKWGSPFPVNRRGRKVAAAACADWCPTRPVLVEERGSLAGVAGGRRLVLVVAAAGAQSPPRAPRARRGARRAHPGQLARMAGGGARAHLFPPGGARAHLFPPLDVRAGRPSPQRRASAAAWQGLPAPCPCQFRRRSRARTAALQQPGPPRGRRCSWPPPPERRWCGACRRGICGAPASRWQASHCRRPSGVPRSRRGGGPTTRLAAASRSPAPSASGAQRAWRPAPAWRPRRAPGAALPAQ